MGETKMKKLWALGMLLGLLTLGAGTASAQFGQMTGQVTAEDGKPWANGIISIDREDIKGHYEVKTDKNGKFFHAGLPLGKFSVTVLKDGKPLFKQGNITTRMNEPATVNINLREERARTEAAAAGVNVQEQAGGKLSEEQMAAIEKASQERAEAIKKRQELTTKFGGAMEAMKAKDYDTAIAQFEAAAAVDATQHVIFAQLGEAWGGKATASKDPAQKKEFYTKSIDNYKKAIELKADDASYHNNYGLALANMGNATEAQAELTQAATLDPVNAGQYYFNLGAVLVNKGQMKEAAEAFTKSTQTTPPFVEGYYQMGVTLIGMATVDPKTGAMVPPEGTKEALEKYLAAAPNGPNAAGAKALLDSLNSAVTTQVGGKPAPAKK
jgi:tetratricopeptide (TPR) repeat protein